MKRPRFCRTNCVRTDDLSFEAASKKTTAALPTRTSAAIAISFLFINDHVAQTSVCGFVRETCSSKYVRDTQTEVCATLLLLASAGHLYETHNRTEGTQEDKEVKERSHT